MENNGKRLEIVTMCYKITIQCYGVTLHFQWAQDEWRKAKKQRRWFKSHTIRAAS